MSAIERVLAENVAAVRERIAYAARLSGRSSADVTLVAVTKYVDAHTAECLVRAGCEILGESRPQDLWQKADALRHLSVQWHLIGHLQRNKIRRTLPWLSCLHSADSTRLLDSLNAECRHAARRLNVLLEVNISRDPDKTGLSPDEALALTQRLPGWEALDVCGLMAMSGRSSSLEQARGEFARVRQLRDHMQALCPGNIALGHLSMGMSDDFEVAIQEGATLVRVGSALLEGVEV